jgi:urocanate hydratase
MNNFSLLIGFKGGFGLVLDGTNDAHQRAENMLSWDVSNGVARRSVSIK